MQGTNCLLRAHLKQSSFPLSKLNSCGSYHILINLHFQVFRAQLWDSPIWDMPLRHRHRGMTQLHPWSGLALPCCCWFNVFCSIRAGRVTYIFVDEGGKGETAWGSVHRGKQRGESNQEPKGNSWPSLNQWGSTQLTHSLAQDPVQHAILL